MHYVSQYNYFKSLDRLARADERKDISLAIASLSRFSLRDTFNNNEILLMYKQRTTLEIIKRWGVGDVKIDIEKIRNELNKRERFFVPQYVMKVNTPRYHKDSECNFLRASFENFETPPEITQLGSYKVSEFQAFCEKEWPNYRDKPVDIFWAHVGSKFRVSINPKEISYGSQEPPLNVVGKTESELIAEIHSKADVLRRFAVSNGVSNYLYAPANKIYARANDQDLEKKDVFLELLRLKKVIKILVFNVHRLELEMSEDLLSDELLEALGFLPCRACCQNR
ncbi:hypothetical protein [Pseudomonas sediminis]|uniref:hypothetical protein n=1 Tax=Pseudomonas sediminis TaxID=1691904 RepID=UPI0031CCBC3B